MVSYLDFVICYSYNFIDIWRLINMCPLPLSCSNRRKWQRKIVKDTQTTQTETQITQKRKITRKETLIWKHEITFFNVLVNITFTILATFQILLLITLSTLRPWTTHDVSFTSADFSIFNYFQLFLEAGSKLV